MAQGGLTQWLAAGWDTQRSLRIDDWGEWWISVTRPLVLGEFIAIATSGLAAWALVALLQRSWARAGGQPGIALGRRGLDGVLFPLLWLGLAWCARMVWLRWDGHAPLMRLALPMLLALAVIRIGVKVLQAALPKARGVRVLERTISWAVWAG